MNREEIRETSGKDSRDQEQYKNEVEAIAGGVGLIAATVLVTLLFVLQLVVGKGIDFGLYAVLFAVGSAQFIVKSYYMRRRRDVALAVFYTAVGLLLTTLHIRSLMG